MVYGGEGSGGGCLGVGRDDAIGGWVLALEGGNAVDEVRQVAGEESSAADSRSTEILTLGWVAGWLPGAGLDR